MNSHFVFNRLNSGKRWFSADAATQKVSAEGLVCLPVSRIVSWLMPIIHELREVLPDFTLAQKTIFGTVRMSNPGRILLVVLLFGFGTLGGFGQTQAYTSSGTYTFAVPAGVTSVTVECWGGGGGGGGQDAGRDGGGGGGGGAYSKKLSIPVISGNSYSVFVGAGGPGIASSKGGDGGDSYFINSSTVLAKGGIGGSPSTDIPPEGGLGGSFASGIGDVKFSGGQGEKGYNGNNGIGGYGGSSAGTAANGYSGPQTYSTNIYPIANTPTGGGNGGNGGVSGQNGSSGSSPGGGGGGSGDGSARKGGNGANGQVIISWTCPTDAGILSGTQNVCVGSTITFSSTVLGGSWSSSDNLIATINPSTGVITGISAGAATIIYDVSSPGCMVATATRSITVDALPAANAGSALPAICTGGTSAALGGIMGGAAISGTWSDGGINGSFSSADISTSTWTPPASYTGTATLTLTTSGGNCGVATASKTITVQYLPTVNRGPVMTAICQGGTSETLGGAVGGSATGGTWTSSAGVTFTPNASTLNATWTAPGTYSGTATLTLTTTGSACNPVSDSKTIDVYANPVITIQPANQLDCEGAFVTFSMVASGSMLTYTWQRKKPADADFTNIPNGEPNVNYPSLGSIRLTNVGNSDAPSGTQYRVLVSNSNCSIISNAALLTVNEITDVLPSVSIPYKTDVIICNGSNFTYTATTSIPSNVVSYQWKKWITPGLWTNVLNGGVISGATASQLVFTGATTSESGEYKVTVTFQSSGANCNVTSDTRTRKLTVLPELQASVTPANQTICYNTSPAQLTATITGGSGTSYSYQWQSSPDNSAWTPISGATLVNYQPPVLTSSTYYRLVVTDTGTYLCGSGTGSSVLVTVNPIPTCTLTGPTPVYSGSTNNTYTSSPTPSDNVTHSWTISGNGTITSLTTGASVTVTAGAAGSFTLTDNIARLGCTSLCTSIVTVINLPCSITPTASVTTGATTTYNAPEGMDTYSWSVTGNGTIPSGIFNQQTVTVLAGNNCNTYTVNLTITKNGARSNCAQPITVTDNIPPTFTPPTLATGYCVADISLAVYKDKASEDTPLDITCLRPDYYLFGVGFTLLNLSAVSDNCALTANPIAWTIDFGNNGSVELSGTGQLSLYGTAIQFPVGTNRITYTVTDAAGNPTTLFKDLVVTTRPDIIRNF